MAESGIPELLRSHHQNPLMQLFRTGQPPLGHGTLAPRGPAGLILSSWPLAEGVDVNDMAIRCLPVLPVMLCL